MNHNWLSVNVHFTMAVSSQVVGLDHLNWLKFNQPENKEWTRSLGIAV
jgi:hypothetical protein